MAQAFRLKTFVMAESIVFADNAESELFNALTDIAHKI